MRRRVQLFRTANDRSHSDHPRPPLRLALEDALSFVEETERQNSRRQQTLGRNLHSYLASLCLGIPYLNWQSSACLTSGAPDKEIVAGTAEVWIEKHEGCWRIGLGVETSGVEGTRNWCQQAQPPLSPIYPHRTTRDDHWALMCDDVAREHVSF